MSNHDIDLFEIVLDREADDMSTEFVTRARAMIRSARTHQRQDRSALLWMAGNIASGVMPGGWMSGNATFESVAKACVSLARAILAEIDRGE